MKITKAKIILKTQTKEDLTRLLHYYEMILNTNIVKSNKKFAAVLSKTLIKEELNKR